MRPRDESTKPTEPNDSIKSGALRDPLLLPHPPPPRHRPLSQRFYDHWRHPHGTLGRQVPGMLTYVQAHQLDTDRLGPGQDEYDGVAMPSFDSPKDANGLVDRPWFVDNWVSRPDRGRRQSLQTAVVVPRSPDKGRAPASPRSSDRGCRHNVVCTTPGRSSSA